MPPAVSVLLPARDAAATLPACLRSLRRQTLPDWECILVDDASRDATGAIAAAAAAADGRIAVVAGPGNGLVAALQTGLAHCSGRWIARMDADDLMHRRRLAVQTAMLAADPRLAGVGSRVRAFPTAALGPGMRDYLRWLDSLRTPAQVRADALVECPVPHPTWLLRGDVLRQHGYRDCGWAEDHDLLLRLLAAGHDFAVAPHRLLAWRRGPGTLSAQADAYRQDRFTACRAAFLAEGFLARHAHYILWGYGRTGRTLRAALAGHGREVAYVVELHPGRLGNRIHGAPVVPPAALMHLPWLPLVVSVAGADNRRRIRADLAAMGRAELRDYVCAA